jgi:hypothetical protein
MAELRMRLGHLAVHGEVHEVLALVVAERRGHEGELGRGLLHALGEVALVEREAKLAVLEDVVRAGLVVAASCRVHVLLAGARARRVVILRPFPSTTGELQPGLQSGRAAQSRSRPSRATVASP